MTGIGLCLPQLGPHVTADMIVRFAERAEELGYASLWVQDHFLWPLEPSRGYGGKAGAPVPEQYQSVFGPLELLAAVAVRTERVKLGTSILVAGNHWPVPLAQRLATLDHLSGGRLLVGIGAGWNAEEHVASGTEITARKARLDDFVPALLACWTDDPIEYHGPVFEVPRSIMRPKPVQRPHPPLLSGMWSPAGLERTAAQYDAWNPAGLPVATVTEMVGAMNARRPAGAPPLEVYFRTFVTRPNRPTPPGDPVERLAEEVADARNAGFVEVTIEHNFWPEITSPADWAAVPDRFAPLLAVAAGSASHAR